MRKAIKFFLSYIAVLLIGASLGAYLYSKYAPPKKEVEIQTIKVIEVRDFNQNVEETITRVCKENGVNPNVCLAVAKCESKLNPFATNLKDFGLYQFNWTRFKNGEINLKEAIDPELATKKFCEIVKKEGLKPWDATRKCWEQEIIKLETSN
jgi:hypothetical protein